jgi:acyl-CoA hydrolase
MKKVSESQVIMTELVLPEHTNALGTIFGGTVMSWIDIAAAIAAQRHARCVCVTASLDALHFKAPIRLGYIVHIKASVNYVGTTSMEIGVRIDSEDPKTGEMKHTSTAYLTFVALDEFGNPKTVPALISETVDEKRRHREALKRREARMKLAQDLKN